MKSVRCVLLALCLVLPAYGQPGPMVGPMPKVPPKAVAKPKALAKAVRGPMLTLPAEVKGAAGGAYIRVPAETDGKSVRWVALDAGLNVFPVELLKDSRTAVVSAAHAGRYRLLAYTAIGGEPSDPAVCVVVIGDAPPDPGPGPGPKPPIPPDPKPPTPVGPLQVLIVYESAEKPTYSEGHKDIIDGKATDDLLRARCPVEPETKQAGFRIWDKDTVANRDLKVWQALLSGPRTAVPWVVIARGGVPVHEGPLPADAAAFAALLESKAKGVRK